VTSLCSSIIPRDARDVEKIVDQPHHVVELPVHRADDAGRVRRQVRQPEQVVDAGAERRERIAQLVRQRRDEGVLLLVRLAERGLRQGFRPTVKNKNHRRWVQ
jgi:hypothetical protein